MTILEHVQSLDSDADVFLYHLSGFDPKNKKRVLKFANASGVSFNGPHDAVPITHDTIEVSGVGSQNRLQLTISDTAGAVTSLMDTVEGGIEGSQVLIIRTKKRYLDNGLTPDSSAILQRSQLTISRVVSFLPTESILVELSNVIDTSNSMVGRSAHTKCPIEYRGPYCTYSGSAMFTLDGQPTLDSSLDVCSKDLKGCKLRFPGGQVLPYHGFPSLTRR